MYHVYFLDCGYAIKHIPFYYYIERNKVAAIGYILLIIIWARIPQTCCKLDGIGKGKGYYKHWRNLKWERVRCFRILILN